jgi:ferredoxin-NADP reductase
LISAGSGATPMMAMLRWLADRHETTDVVWVHAARTPADVAFAAELAALDAAMPNLRLATTVSAVPAGESWAGYCGRIDRRMLALMVPDLARREVFCCGPNAFMEIVARIHGAEGGEPGRFHTESFGAAENGKADLPEPLAAACRPPEGAFSIRIGERSFGADPAQTILAAAQANGIVIPTGCRNGICGTCRMKKRSGEVDMHHNGGLSVREERADYVLACCSRPLTDLALDRPSR